MSPVPAGRLASSNTYDVPGDWSIVLSGLAQPVVKHTRHMLRTGDFQDAQTHVADLALLRVLNCLMIEFASF